MKSRVTLLMCSAVAIYILHCTASLAAPMGTAFTYQGRFDASGTPANGAYDFEFRLLDAATAGNQIGSTITKNDLTVSNGYFTTRLDFGAGIFTGDARWLQIAVRPGAETGAYTALTPRHELTPSPYAINSGNDGPANYIPRFTGTGLADSVLYESASNIGIGTTTPGVKLDVNGDLRIHGDTATLTFRRSTGPSNIAHLNYDHTNSCFDIAANNKAMRFLTQNNWVETMRLTSTGNLGIGTTAPSERLAVAGNLHLAAYDPFLYWDSNALNLKSKSDAIPVVVIRGSASYNSRFQMYSAGDAELRVYLNTNGVSYINGGNIGVGTTSPAERLDVAGTVRCVSVVQTSDEQLKTDVRPLAGVLEKINQVRGVSFRWNEKAQSLGAESGETRIGVLAQELERVFPELVTTPQPITADELAKTYPGETLTPEVRQRLQRDAEATQYKAVDYSQLTVVLLEAVKELQKKNQALEMENASLEERLTRLEHMVSQNMAR